jgi:outer membrane autotransporter barrel domain protein
MKNGENFNSAADASKSFEDAYGSWDALREELNQKQEAKAEADAFKKREEELKKGAKKFDKSVRDAIHKGDKVAFDEMMERDEHYRQMENSENRVESEQPYEISTLSKEEMDQAAGASSEIQRMNSLAKMIQNAESEEAKNKYRQQLIEASNDFSKNGVNFDGLKNKLEDRFIWEYSKKPEYRQKVLDTIWENAMAEPDAKKSNPDDGAKNEALNNGDDAEKQKPEVIELSDAEKKFDELFSKDVSAEELARFRRQVRSELIQKNELTPENEAMLERMLETSLAVGNQERELNKANSSIDNDSNIEKKVSIFRKIGHRIMKLGALGILAVTIFGVGRQSSEGPKSNDNSPRTEQTFSGTVHANSLNGAANFNSDGSVIESEKNFNNGKYDSENDDYNKIDQKESKYSIGTDTSKLSNEEYQKKMIESHNEDDIEYMGQFFVNDPESARNLLGISNNEVDDLVDAARNGDRTAFQKLNDAYSKYMEGAKVVGNQTLDGDYYSLFVNSNKDYAHAEGAFGGTARVVELKNGQQILIRDQCKQMVMKKIAEVPNTWTTPVIPFEEAYTPPAPDTEKPPAPTPETPPETPPTTPDTPPTPETPPEKHDDTKFKTDQSIYNIDNAVTRIDKGELIGEASQEERNNNINPEVTPGTATSKIKAEGVNESIDVSKIGEQPAEYTGETTAEAQAQAAEQARQVQAETEAKAREAEQAQNKTVNIGGETVNYNDVWAAQQNYNQTYGSSVATNQNNTQQ